MADSEYADKARTNLSNGAAADNTNEDQAGNNDTADQDNTDNGEAAAPDADADLIAQALAMQALQAGAGADTETGAE